jgi:hypothetical protein
MSTPAASHAVITEAPFGIDTVMPSTVHSKVSTVLNSRVLSTRNALAELRMR